MRRDPGALLAERFLGDLDDDLLTFLQQFRDRGRGRRTLLDGTRYRTRRLLFCGRLAAADRDDFPPVFLIGSPLWPAALPHSASHAARHPVHVAAALLANIR